MIKDLERIRPSSILDIVKSGEDMAALVPSEINGNAVSGDGEDNTTGCGSTGRTSGGEMIELERRLVENEQAKDREIEIRVPTPRAASARGPSNAAPSTHDKKRSRRKIVPQVMGQCEKCGYLSSQKTCKACMLLEGLNRNRPKTEIDLGKEEKEAKQTVHQLKQLEIT